MWEQYVTTTGHTGVLWVEKKKIKKRKKKIYFCGELNYSQYRGKIRIGGQKHVHSNG